MKIRSFLSDHIILISIIVAAALIRAWKYTYLYPSWDPSAYIQMGKYLFTNGHMGFIEPFRPLLWPLLLGMGFKLGFSPIIWGDILNYMFSMGNIVLIYRIGLRVYDKPTGLIAALLLSISPTHFYYGNILYSDISASFFGLLSVWLFVEKNYFLSGILIGVTFFTRFIYLITMAVMICFSFVALFKNKPKQPWILPALFISGILLSVILFLSLNLRLYHNAFQPFLDAHLIYSQIYFEWGNGILLSILKLFSVEKIILVFTPLILFTLIQPNASFLQRMIPTIGIGLFLWIGKWPMDIPRFLTACVPYLYLSAAYGFLAAYRSTLNLITKVLLLGLMAYCLSWQIIQIHKIYFPPNKLTIMQKYVIKHAHEIKNGLWISDPTSTVFSDLKVEKPMYYPVTNNQMILELSNNLGQANYIFYDGNFLICRPTNDKICEENKAKLLKKIINNFEIVFPDSISHFTNYGIFKRPPRLPVP